MKKNTKQTIKDKARVLFNEQGLSDTSLRNIAGALGMSQGNLNYHYKVKQDLVEALYFELVAKMDEGMQVFAESNSLLEVLYQSSEKMLAIFYEYRFLLKDLYKIFKENEKIKVHYTQLQKIREQQFLLLFEGMIGEGIMRKADFEKEYEHLYIRMQIIGDHWIASQEVLNPDLKNPVIYYNYILLEMLYPYLTTKGKKQFLEIKKGYYE